MRWLLPLLAFPALLAAQDVRATQDSARAAIAASLIAGARDTVDAHIARAIGFARRAVAAAPTDAESHYLLAAALGRRALRTGFRTALGAATESYRAAQRALVLDSTHAGAHAAVGRFHEELGRHPWPVRATLAALSGEGDVRSASRERAEEAYRTAIRLAPDDVQFRNDYGRLLLLTGRSAEAAEQARIAATLPIRRPVDAWFRDDLRRRVMEGR
jgi:Flp pilus assembly protein TadD